MAISYIASDIPLSPLGGEQSSLKALAIRATAWIIHTRPAPLSSNCITQTEDTPPFGGVFYVVRERRANDNPKSSAEAQGGQTSLHAE